MAMIKSFERIFLTLITGGAALAPILAHAAPITFNTALPLSEDEHLFRQQFIFAEASDNLLGLERDVETFKAVSVFGYGLNRRLALFGVVPFISQDKKIGTLSDSNSGLGDVTLFARYEVFRRDRLGKTVRLAPFFGLTLPTGREGETSDGSFDQFAGLVFTRASTSWNFDSQIKYVNNNENNGFEAGDAVSVDASVQYRLSNRNEEGAAKGFLFAVLELNATRSEKNRILSLKDANSGGDLVTLSPGLQYARRRWIAETALRVPISKNLNGTALAPDYALVTSMRFNF